jgi:hypothetical protein
MCEGKKNYMGNSGVLTKLYTDSEKQVCCDECLVEVIEALNNAGFITTSSCCGHGEISAGIIFDPEKVRLMRRKKEAPFWEEIDIGDILLEVREV